MDTIAMHRSNSAAHFPSADVIARGWLTDLVKFCRAEIKGTKRRVTQYEVWERVQTMLEDNPITDNGEPITLPPERDRETRAVARRVCEATSRATEVGLAVRL